MPKIDIDQGVYDYISKEAISFEEHTPNQVIRRLLGLGKIAGEKIINTSEVKSSMKEMETRFANRDRIKSLNLATRNAGPSFLTFLFDKHQAARGDFDIRDLENFMSIYNLVVYDRDRGGNLYQNPWMNKPYGAKATKNHSGVISLTRTIEHFRQCRKFGCWNGRDQKEDCDLTRTCRYHPKYQGPDKPQNNCDLDRPVIWKRSNPDAPWSFGANYITSVRKGMLNGQPISLKALVELFYEENENRAVERFIDEFNITVEEQAALFL